MNDEQRTTRRTFLTIGAAASAAAIVSPAALVAAEGRSLERVGIQLYTVRDRMAADVPGTLERIAGIGYDEVEFAGYFEHSPADIRAMLAANGLASPAAHVPLDGMRNEPESLIDAASEVGHDYLVLAWLGEDERRTLDQYRAHAELCNRFGERCRDAGIQFAWHNHEFEFEALDGVLPMDLLLAETDPDLMQIEIDLYWTRVADVDPIAYFDKHPGRFPLCHVKDMAADGAMADVGDGTMDFAGIFAASEQAGLKHYFVERDNPTDSLESAARSYAALSTLKF